MAFYGAERGGGGSWWSWEGDSMASLSRHVCPLPPSARHKHTHTHTQRHADTHTHTHTHVSCHVPNLSTS